MRIIVSGFVVPARRECGLSASFSYPQFSRNVRVWRAMRIARCVIGSPFAPQARQKKEHKRVHVNLRERNEGRLLRFIRSKAEGKGEKSFRNRPKSKKA